MNLRLCAAATLALAAAPALPGDPPASCGPSAAICPIPETTGPDFAPPEPARQSSAAEVVLVAYWREGCPRCDEARPFLGALAAAEPRLRVEWVRVGGEGEGRRRFLADVERIGVAGAGLPMFVAGEEAVVGFRRGVTEDVLRVLVRRALDAARPVLAPDASGPSGGR